MEGTLAILQVAGGAARRGRVSGLRKLDGWKRLILPVGCMFNWWQTTMDVVMLFGFAFLE